MYLNKKKYKNRIKPYPPNFKTTPANNIDPATGASTWAFGSHKWNGYIGILIKNPIRNNHQKKWILLLFKFIIPHILSLKPLKYKKPTPMRKNKEPKTV